MLEDFIKSLSQEQKQALLESLMTSLDKPEPTENPELKSSRELMNEYSATAEKESVRDVDLDFTVTKEKGEVRTRIPVTENKRFNSFVDDGTESKGKEFTTPDVKLTERRRPAVKNIKQKCSKCDKVVNVHPAHARDWFICDRCIGAR